MTVALIDEVHRSGYRFKPVRWIEKTRYGGASAADFHRLPLFSPRALMETIRPLGNGHLSQDPILTRNRTPRNYEQQTKETHGP
jgi:hypothetical protein